MSYISILIITLDQITKRTATYCFERNIFISYLGFSNVLTCNKGISFSWLEQNKYAFLLKYIVLFFLFLVTYLLYKTKDKFEALSLNLMLGGGLSNTIDRFLFNGVIDFIHFNPLIISPIIFNFADLMITIGTVFFIINTLFLQHKGEK